MHHRILSPLSISFAEKEETSKHSTHLWGRILGSFSLHTSLWKRPLFNEKEFKSFHISDGIYIFILIWLRDLPGTVIHAPSNDIGRLWAGRKKKRLLSMVRLQGVCQERKVSHARNPASGKPPKDCLPTHSCCSEETAPLFHTRSIFLFLTKFSNAYSWRGWGSGVVSHNQMIKSHPRFLKWR